MDTCYNLNPNHFGEVKEYTDGVDTHPLCRKHAEQAGFEQPETTEELLTRIERELGL